MLLEVALGFSYDKMAYEKRYARVYEAGARFWEEPMPTEELVEFVHERRFSRCMCVIEFGCGDGRDAVFLARQGFRVTAIDVVPSAINRARESARQVGARVDFEVGDVTDLERFPSSTYDLAVNVGCLHMIVEERARSEHLKEAFRVLKPMGMYFSCNIGSDRPVTPEHFYSTKPRPGDLAPRKIKVDGEEKEIMLPVIAAWPKSGEQYWKEFEAAGYEVQKMQKRIARAPGPCWIIMARKTSKATSNQPQTSAV